MAMPQPMAFISEDDYVIGEEESDTKHEYVNGQVYAMVGTSANHNLISVNLVTLLRTELPDRCEVFMADMKVRIETKQDLMFYYPDVIVACEEEDRAIYYREKPCLIVEVLSPSSKRQDFLEKFRAYQQISTLQEYLLIAQEKKEATLFRRFSHWQPEVYQEGTFHLDSVNLEVSLDALYRLVRF